jgi:isopenicillin N synthase-like dioxygenase
VSLIAEARTSASDKIPIIDFAPFRNGEQRSRLQVAKQIADASETVGFLYLANHGVPAEKLQAVFAAARDVFKLPRDILDDPELQCTPTRTRGYMPLQSRHYAGTGAPDLMEAFKFQQDLPADDFDIREGNRVHQKNRWPQNNPEFRRLMLDYFDEVTKLSHELLRAFAVALDLDEAYFLKFFKKPLTQVSLIHYPPQSPAAAEDEYGVRPHADATAFTILAQDDVGGLQVQGKAGSWINVKPIPGSYVINIGDMMARWTNDRFASTMHRVFNRSGRERYSVPFFGIPDFDAIIECLPTCQSASHPAKYPPLKVGDFMNRKNSSDWSRRRQQVENAARQ